MPNLFFGSNIVFIHSFCKHPSQIDNILSSIESACCLMHSSLASLLNLGSNIPQYTVHGTRYILVPDELKAWHGPGLQYPPPALRLSTVLLLLEFEMNSHHSLTILMRCLQALYLCRRLTSD